MMQRPARLVLVCAAISLLTAAVGCRKADEEPVGKPSSTNGGGKSAGQLTKPQEVLEKMAAAYKNATTYADKGTVRLLAETTKGQIDQKANFSVVLERPNRLRMQVYQANVVCDGQKWCAFIEALPGQVVLRNAPAKLGLAPLAADPTLYEALTRGFAGPAPQALLLLGDDPVKELLSDSEATTLGESATIDNQPCYRVQVKRADGTAVYYIDQETFVLRRMVLPTDDFRRILERDGEVKNLSVVAEFTGARLGGKVDPKAFEFEIPKEARQATFFSQPGPFDFLGKKAADFKLLDLQGNAVTPQSLAGKIVALEFWQINCEPCRVTLPNLEAAYQKFKDNSKVAVYAVSLDPADTKNQALEDSLKELKVAVPILRDPDQQANKAFGVLGPPTAVLLDGNGVVQACDMGGTPAFSATLAEKIEKLLAGEDLAKTALTQYQEQQRQMAQAIDERFQGKSPVEEVSKATIAAKSEPKSLRLQPLWKCSDLKSPGNILVVPSPNGPPKLFVIDSWSTVVEVGTDGKVVATHKPALADKEVICNLRTGVGGDGKRYFAAFAAGEQRIHLFDESWKLLTSFPENALKNRHPGIAEVQLGDVEGDGQLKAYVGYWGVVGVQEASMEGKILWSNRALVNVMRMAFSEPDATKQRDLLCANMSGSIAVLDAKGHLKTNISLPNWPISLIAAADLADDGHLQWAGLAMNSAGNPAAVGFNLKGEVLWNHPVPKGQPQQPVELLVPGRVLAKGPGQWLLPAVDGSIHVVSADGKPLDQFNYGAVLCGVAAFELDGKPILVVSTEKGIEAWRIEN